MATRKRVKSVLPKIRKLVAAGAATEEARKEIFKLAMDILNDTDLQNADYSEDIWTEMIKGDTGRDFTPDELPNAKGEFGRTESNPIPVNGATGEVTYLSRLIWDDSKKPQLVVFHRLGSKFSPEANTVVDIFEILTIDGSHYDILYLDMYHIEQSKKVPKGYKLGKQVVGITGESIGPNPEFPKGTFERTFQYAMATFGAPVVNPMVHQLNIEAGLKTVAENRKNNLGIEATANAAGAKVPEGFKPVTQEMIESLKKKNDGNNGSVSD